MKLYAYDLKYDPRELGLYATYVENLALNSQLAGFHALSTPENQPCSTTKVNERLKRTLKSRTSFRTCASSSDQIDGPISYTNQKRLAFSIMISELIRPVTISRVSDEILLKTPSPCRFCMASTAVLRGTRTSWNLISREESASIRHGLL